MTKKPIIWTTGSEIADLLRYEKFVWVRVETWLLVTMVLIMLVLGSYNVLYRNVLVAWQKSLATSGPPVVPDTPEDNPASPSPDPGGSGGFGGFGGAEGDDAADDADGFGGGFGAEDPAGPPSEGAEPAGDGAAGFGGGFGDSDDDEGDDDAKQPAGDSVPGAGSGGSEGDGGDGDGAAAADPPAAAGGFGGGFGADETDGEDGEDGDGSDGFGGGFGAADEDEGGGFGGGFGDAPAVPTPEEPRPAYRNPPPTDPEGGPPPEGSFAAGMVRFIDAIKLDWIDTLLRQLVIMVGFFGAMIATQRRKHINIDAASKLLPDKVRGWIAMAMNLLATGMSVMLAVAGWNLVAISQAFPKEIIPHLDEWHMQLMFPVGFGMLGVHFLFRSIEDLDQILKGLPPIAGGETAELEKEKAERQAAAQETA